jgi:signal transduction histidine kinase
MKIMGLVKGLSSDQQLKALFVVMVVIGYIVTFAFIAVDDIRSVTFGEAILAIAIGVIYTLLGVNDRLIFDRIPAMWANVIFFTVQCSLLFASGWILGIGGNVLVGLPLAAYAVERLRPRWRWVVYVSLAAVIVLPVLQLESWTSVWLNGLTVTTAILFVAMFAQLRLNEQEARERAEQLSTALEQANVQLAEYATQAEELAMTQERNRLAREIHDSLGHTLTVVNVQIEAARAVMESDPARALDALTKVQDLAQKGLTQVRQSVAALRESPVRDRPLADAIRPLVTEVESSGIVTDFQVIGEPYELEHKAALAMYRAAQEGLTNVCRHARASRVDISLDFQHAEIRLEVLDNGVGAAQLKEGFGLLGIRERMQLLGGRMQVETATGEGFRLEVLVPVESTSHATSVEG